MSYDGTRMTKNNHGIRFWDGSERRWLFASRVWISDTNLIFRRLPQNNHKINIIINMIMATMTIIMVTEPVVHIKTYSDTHAQTENWLKELNRKLKVHSSDRMK